MQYILLLGIVALLPLSAAVTYPPNQVKLCKKISNLTTSLLSQPKLIKLTDAVFDMAYTNSLMTMEQMSELMINHFISKWSDYVDPIQVSSLMPVYLTCENCLKKSGSDVMTTAKKLPKALSKVMGPPYKAVMGMINTKKANNAAKLKIKEDVMLECASYLCVGMIKQFMKPAKCSVSCGEWKCGMDNSDKICKLRSYDDAANPCGTCQAAG